MGPVTEKNERRVLCLTLPPGNSNPNPNPMSSCSDENGMMKT